MTTKMMKPMRIFAQITRVDKTERIVEGHCYVNAVVGDGVNLTRKSMVAATPDYLKYGAVRAMHEPIAAGQAVSVEWDDRGALLRAKITDDTEWKKCEDGTYKGFSVGVNPVVMRGDKTVKVDWIEVSLVDRPFDPDANFVVARAQGVSDETMKKEVKVTMLEPGEKWTGGKVERKAKAAKAAKPDVTPPAVIPPKPAVDSADVLTVEVIPEGADVSRIKTKKLAKMAKKIGKVSQALSSQYRAAETELKRRGETLTTEAAAAPNAGDAALLQRMTAMESQVTRLQSDLAAKDKQLKKSDKTIKRIGKQPAASQKPIRWPAAIAPLERNFGANEFQEDSADSGDLTALKSEYDALAESAQKEPDSSKRQQAAVQLGIMAATLSENGYDV